MNPFEDPELVDPEINKEIKELVLQLFKDNGRIMFYDILQYYETAINDKDVKRAKIIGYYCVNVINNSNDNLTASEKQELISGLVRTISWIV